MQDQIIKKNNQKQLLYDIEMPLIEILSEMQMQGIGIEKEKLIEYSNILNEKISELSKEIYGLAGEEFNINSPKQLGEVLFERLNLKSSKKTQRGYSTDAESLEKIREEHPIIDKILEYKQYAKLKSTYADGLNNVINPQTGRIHSKFNQMVTATGRLSSTDPNLQNIPVRHEAGRLFRNMFVARDGYEFIDADYSQIELRILAALSDDDAMINAFNSGDDVHKTTAMQVFGVSEEDVTPLMRARAKAVNFGIVYGQGDFSLGQDLGISKKEAKEYIDKYFEKFPNIKNYLDRLVSDAKEKGYANTIFNRVRYLPEINSQNFHIRSFNERVAMNMPIQGTAADIIKIAMVKVHEKLRTMKSKLILQVHDELLIEVAEDEIDEVKSIIQKSMEEAVDLKVELKVELGVGKTWGEAK
jgi:DNA polymerase-1